VSALASEPIGQSADWVWLFLWGSAIAFQRMQLFDIFSYKYQLAAI
jgi:hypothetical protein